MAADAGVLTSCETHGISSDAHPGYNRSGRSHCEGFHETHECIWGLAVLLIGGMTGGGRSMPPAATPSSARRRTLHTRSSEPVVTPVAGSSWLNHLGIRYRDTSLGRGAGRYGPARTNRRPIANRSRCRSSAPFS